MVHPPEGLLPLRASIVRVMAIPVATGRTDTAPRSPKPASLSASLVSRLVNFARSDEPAAYRLPSDIMILLQSRRYHVQET